MQPMEYKREFFRRLARAAGKTRHGRMTELSIRLADHLRPRVTVTAYAGSFSDSEQGEPLPRICVSLNGSGCPDLELTCMLTELPEWAEWVLAWTKARLGLTDNVPLPPSRLVRRLTPPDLGSACYLWTDAADHRCGRWRRARLKRSRACQVNVSPPLGGKPQ
jgi:hypothetical protein